MNFLDKLQKIKKLIPSNEPLEIMVDIADDGIDESMIVQLKKGHPFLPDSYCELLAFSDGMEIFGIVFYGSESHGFSSLEWIRNLAEPVIDLKSNFPFAKDADGSIFSIHKNGKVIWNLNENNKEIIAYSFDEFMDEVMLGSSYHKINPYGIDEEDEWNAFIVEQGWASDIET